MVGKRCSTANTGAAILLVQSGPGPLCVNKIELVLWFIYSFDHLGFFLTHYAVYKSISFSFLILKRTIFMSSKEVLIVMDNELQLWWLLHFAHWWPYYIYVYSLLFCLCCYWIVPWHWKPVFKSNMINSKATKGQNAKATRAEDRYP